VRKRRPPQPAQLGYLTRTPNGMGNRTGARRPPTPRYIYTEASPEARPAAFGCALCGTQARPLPPLQGPIWCLRGHCRPVGAQRLPIRALWPPARIGHSGPLATVRAAGSITPPRARVSGVSPIPFAGTGHGVTPTHPFARRCATPRLVATCGVRGDGSVDLRPLAGTARISLQGYVAYLLNILILGPVAPLTGQYSRGGLN